MKRLKVILCVFILILMSVSTVFAFGIYAKVKILDRGRVVLVDRKFYKGPGIVSFWGNYDNYEIDGAKLINTSRDEYICLEKIPSFLIKRAYIDERAGETILISYTGEAFMLMGKPYMGFNTYSEYALYGGKLYTQDNEWFDVKPIKISEIKTE